MPKASKPKTTREFSAGGVVVRHRAGRDWMIAIEPAPRSNPVSHPKAKPVLALPKGIIDPGESPEQTAVREVREETGVTATLVKKLGDVRYVYTRAWGDRARVFKVVSFFLLRYRSGRLGDLPSETRHEVKRVNWIPLEDAPKLLTFKGDQDMARRAMKSIRD